MTPEELAKSIDYTILRADATPKDIKRVCTEAVQYSFATVFVNPCYVSLAYSFLRGTPVKVGTTVGFPLGGATTTVKCFEAVNAISHGAHEIDMVMYIGALKLGAAELVQEDIHAVVGAVRTEEMREGVGEVLVKVIIETCYLSDEEKRVACRLVEQAGADFVKTSTSFGLAGATVKDVELIRESLGQGVGVKASGGIRTLKQAIAMIDAGASRLGTSSGVDIMKEMLKKK